MSFISRQVAKNFLAIEQAEGVGARVRRSIGTGHVRNFSPFLMLDHFKTGKGGFPDHPHRGQETITYMIKGYVDHEDFTGSKGTIGPGDLQFMTAGRGIVHAEMPRADGSESPEGMQLWVDLPASLKECEPRYRDLMAKEIPVTGGDGVEVKVISGESHGTKSVQDLAYTPVWFLEFIMQPGSSYDQEMPKDFNSFAYVLEGNIKVDNTTAVDEHHCALFDRPSNADGVRFSVDASESKPARFIFVGGQVLNQPIVQHGPFVETSKERIYKAFVDYQSGTNGFERALNWESEIGKRKIQF